MSALEMVVWLSLLSVLLTKLATTGEAETLVVDKDAVSGALVLTDSPFEGLEGAGDALCTEPLLIDSFEAELCGRILPSCQTFLHSHSVGACCTDHSRRC